MKASAQKYAHELSGSINKKYFYYSGHPYPLKILECNTHKTGKHGCAKTTLRMEDLINERAVADIVPSDEIFYAMEEHPLYYALPDSEITCLYYDEKKETAYADITTFDNENLSMPMVFEKVKVHSTGLKTIQKYFERVEEKLKPVLEPESANTVIKTNLLRWTVDGKENWICLNIFIQKIE